MKLFLVTFILKEEEQVEERKILVFEAFATNDLRISPPRFPPCNVDRLDVGQDVQMKLTGEIFSFLSYNQCLGLMQIVYNCAVMNATQESDELSI